MFPTFLIYQPETQNSVTICKLSYVAAALFGTFYFAIKAGHVRLLAAMALHLFCVLALAALLMGTSVLPGPVQAPVLLVAVPAVLLFQSVKMVGLVKRSYRQRRWIVQQDD